MVTRALLPLKDLVAAKTRLAGILAPSERRALMQAMAEDVLAVLAEHPGIQHITLLSDDPAATLLARRYGAEHCAERSLGCRGLNAVLAAACARVAAPGEAATAMAATGERVMILHADLPWLSAADLDAALAQQAAAGGLLVGTDRAGRGTNLLLFGAEGTPDFHFGVDSCARHVAAARRTGQAVRVLQRSGIARDVDTPADVAELLMTPANDGCEGALGAATRAVLGQPGLAPRLRLALAGLESDNNMGAGNNHGAVS
ncbi:2-phospho-L-lactate guanylyltransferase [Parahaliea mediterranea]|uniref:3-phospho-D-glycerate guanylyltransferase n=1 Tax=Parahaliea mediterranea TaxID=651086 RepID=A0A939IJT7_9GAMM|nr:2-phospho-L-lactate guanylyltransferase [Parahaliea mediterranea]MBN7798029.1 2-phospho-L-lactate guanylyltransferase [Parahaliea mediterranea]